MAVAKTARVMGTERLGPDTLLLDLCATEPVVPRLPPHLLK